MALHRRTPKQNRKKLKSVDPFNRKASSIKAEKLKGKNFEPKANTDEQPLSRSQKKLIEAKNEPVTKETMKKKKTHRNRILEEAERHGLKKGRFESVEKFVRRCERTMKADVNDHILIAKKGLSGRAEAEINAEYKKLEDAEEKKKEAEKKAVQSRIEKARKQREKEENKRNETRIAKEKRREKRRQNEATDNEEKEEEAAAEPSISKKKEKNPESKAPEVEMPCFFNKKRKHQEKNDPADALNTIEVVPFGARYDAPPTFSKEFKRKMDPLMAKAGSKTLLLHSLLSKSN
ncbi:unnamed protein product [Caenorhabditis auriculariae]|uniref:Uncharacterized protein n=1 Tax=Caenorhabditis auriculariae TaxID=2777116 RepID=A0A8S1HET1_9PELO|nr:unnamed protein product [Caenorhabditis auriculariae]